jgi:hypothetical protein
MINSSNAWQENNWRSSIMRWVVEESLVVFENSKEKGNNSQANKS